MTAFTARRVIHQSSTSAEITGDLPVAAFLAGCKRKDGGSTGDGKQEDILGYRAWTFGWLGCLDAPERLPTGGCRAVFIPEHLGGHGFEGIAAVNYARGA